MTNEGVGETRSLADALKFFVVSVRCENPTVLFRGGLEPLVAVAPEFRRSREQSGDEQGDEHSFVHEVTSP